MPGCATWLDQVISGYGPVLAPDKVSEPHDDKLGSRLNWLRGVLGAIDGQRDTELAATAQANGSCTKSQRPPLVAILLPPPAWRVPVTVLAVLAALRLTAALSARLSDAHRAPALLRLVLGGALGLAVTYGTGHLCGSRHHLKRARCGASGE